MSNRKLPTFRSVREVFSFAKDEGFLPCTPKDDLTGKTFNHLEVVALVGKLANRKSIYYATVCNYCKSGDIAIRRSDAIKDKRVLSCGCIQRLASVVNVKKGLELLGWEIIEYRETTKEVWQLRCPEGHPSALIPTALLTDLRYGYRVHGCITCRGVDKRLPMEEVIASSKRFQGREYLGVATALGSMSTIKFRCSACSEEFTQSYEVARRNPEGTPCCSSTGFTPLHRQPKITRRKAWH